ncbi:MAG: type II toxin-antitoxin system RelE/ParE family toxin [Pirellulales bacterium]
MRRFSVASYVVYYRAVSEGIQILRVLHGSRDIPAAWRAE